MPKFGINKNPATNVPTILPIVDNDEIFPDVFPTSSCVLSSNFTAYGDTIANIKLGIPNTTAEHIIATNTKLLDNSDSGCTRIASNIGIKLVKNAPANINADNTFISGFLSANFPPNQYPMLILVNIIPIIVVHIKLELPTYGDNILAATNSNTIPNAPHKNTVIFILYFFIRSPLNLILYEHLLTVALKQLMVTA